MEVLIDLFNQFSYCMNLIHEVERKYPVQQWTIDGVHVWPILRIYHSYNEKGDMSNELSFKNTYKTIVETTFKKIIKGIKRYIFLYKMESKDPAHNDYADEHRDILFLSYSVYRKTKINNLCYFTEIFPFLQELNNNSYLILELASNGVWNYPRYGKSMFLDRRKYVFHLINKFRSMLSFRHRYVSSIDCHQLQEVYQYLAERKVRLLPLKQLIAIVREINELKLFYLKLLKKTTPKIVIIECYYGRDGFALILAAKQMGIPVADLQHGNQSFGHEAYGNWPANPCGYQLLPDYFFVWSDKEKNNIQNWNRMCGSKHKPIVTGYQWLSLWKGKELPIDFKCQVEQIKKCQAIGCNVNILYSMTRYFLSDSVIRFIQNSPSNWQWWIRMHPTCRHKWSDYSEKIKQLFHNNNIVWEESSECSLPALLSFIDLHMTYGSTITNFCQEWGIPSIVEDTRILVGNANNKELVSLIPAAEWSVKIVDDILERSSNAIKGDDETNQTEIEFIREVLLKRC